jgi:hypothetical protein
MDAIGVVSLFGSRPFVVCRGLLAGSTLMGVPFASFGRGPAGRALRPVGRVTFSEAFCRRESGRCWLYHASVLS